MKVTCKMCKKKIDKKDSFQVTFEGRKVSTYFCNKFEHDNYLSIQNEIDKEKESAKLRKQQFNELDIYIASEILGYEIGKITPPFLKKRIQTLAKSYDYEVIKLCLEYMKKDLHYYLNNKEFEDERHKVNYIMVIVENNINDTYKIWKRKKEIEQKQQGIMDNTTYDIDEIKYVSQKVVNKNNTDISNFLMEDDI